MIFIYPKQAITTKDIEQFLYQTYNAIGINMNKYNNDSSNVFSMIDIACSELERVAFDINYQFSMKLNEIDFTTIDRINRFYAPSVFGVKEDVYSITSNIFYGYSKYTNLLYEMYNINSFTDFTRHSYPCDVFLEKEYKVSPLYTLDPVSVKLPKLTEVPLTNFYIKNSKVTITCLTIGLQNSKMPDNEYFSIVIKGLNYKYKKIEEEILFTDIGENLISENEYTEITSVLCKGLTTTIDIIIYPYQKNLICKTSYPYIDREEQYVYDGIYSIDTSTNQLVLNIINDSILYPNVLEPRVLVDLNCMIETSSGVFDKNAFDFNVFQTDVDIPIIIEDHHFDEPNKLLYTIMSYDSDRYLLIYPLILPLYKRNFGQLKRSERQTLKITYTKDSVLKKYSIYIFPSDKVHGVESLTVSIKYPYLNPRGVWSGYTSYIKGDFVYYNNIGYVCTDDHTSTTYIGSQFIKQTNVIVDDLLLDLVTYNLETNLIEIDFDTLFPYDVEAIIQFDTSGYENTSYSIFAQNHKLNPLVVKTLSSVLSVNTTPATIADTVYPIENNKDLLLMDNITSYKQSPITDITLSSNLYLYTLSSTANTLLNNYRLIHVYNTFYLDWDNTKTIITSDTITYLTNNVVQPVDKSFIAVNSDDYDRLF